MAAGEKKKQDHKHSERVGCEFFTRSFSALRGWGVSAFNPQSVSWTRASAMDG